MSEWRKKTTSELILDAYNQGWEVHTRNDLEFISGDKISGILMIRKGQFQCYIYIADTLFTLEIQSLHNLADNLYPRTLIILCPDTGLIDYHLGKLSIIRVHDLFEFWNLLRKLHDPEFPLSLKRHDDMIKHISQSLYEMGWNIDHIEIKNPNNPRNYELNIIAKWRDDK